MRAPHRAHIETHLLQPAKKGPRLDLLLPPCNGTAQNKTQTPPAGTIIPGQKLGHAWYPWLHQVW